MKNSIVLALAAVLVLACAPAKPATPAAQAITKASTVYKDGTYKVTYDHFDSRGWKAFIEIQIRDGAVVSANHDYVNAKGEYKSKDEAYAQGMKKKSNLTPVEASQQLIDRLVERNAADIDAVTGATGTSASFKELAAAGLAAAVKGDKAALELPANDTYTAKDTADERGYTGEIAITFEGGKITKVVFDEKDKDGKAKRTDESYNTNMKAKTKTSWTEAAAALEASLVAKQDAKAVDAVAGATGASTRFKALAAQALSFR